MYLRLIKCQRNAALYFKSREARKEAFDEIWDIYVDRLGLKYVKLATFQPTKENTDIVSLMQFIDPMISDRVKELYIERQDLQYRVKFTIWELIYK
jgi:hypothetical protein